MDSETRTFYYIVIVWVLLVLLGSLLQKCCSYREIFGSTTNYIYGDTGPPNDYFIEASESGNTNDYVRAPEILITCLQREGPSVKTNEFDKPPSYDEDPPTYIQAIEMDRKNNNEKIKDIYSLTEIKFS